MMGWYRDLRLRWKLLGAFGLVLLLATALNLLALRGVVSNEESAALVNDTRAVLSLADEALITLVDMESGVRGFILTGREEFLEPYEAGRALYQQRLDALQQATADRPGQAGRGPGWRVTPTRRCACGGRSTPGCARWMTPPS
jgi:methyl-accepting chemotaxis protein